LSKGEQQLYATALLKALVDESGIQFPVFIDSPLQKFDKHHSTNIINEFYPVVSNQVVLLPLLEKELTEKEFDLLEPSLNKTFIIENKDDNNSYISQTDIRKEFKQIKTSKENKEIVSQLTRKLNLGKENTIARIAYTYSLSKDEKLDLSKIEDSQGKEYSKSVLFGDNFDIYLGLICTHYNLYKTDKNIPKYIKMHIDHGLKLIDKELNDNPKYDGFDFLVDKINLGLSEIS